MTADQIFDHVIALMFGDDSDKEDYEARFLVQLNMKLADLFFLNNSIREGKGMHLLEEPPFVESLEQNPGYEWEIERDILPIGIAADLYADDDETGISNVYRETYDQKKYERQKAKYQDELI